MNLLKSLKDAKRRIYFYYRSLSREKIAIFICIPLTLVALSVCAVILLVGTQNSAPQISAEEILVTAPEAEKQTYPQDSPYALEFKSLGNGSCSVVGIGEFKGKSLKIPSKNANGETVTKISGTAFKGCDELEAITVPSSVSEISVGAFVDCESLIYIDVDIDNEYFTSIGGVLFTKNRARLICYPQSKLGEKYYLNPNVTVIDDYAFYGVSAISVIHYPKSTADFEAIRIGKGNELLHSLPITCNYTGGK